MSELSAQNSYACNDCKNIDNVPKEIVDQSENVRKRKSKMSNETLPKQLKNNYYSILDNDKDCDKERLKIFEKHVQERNNPSTSHYVSNNTTNKEVSSNKESSKNNTSYKQNKSSLTKVPPLNIFDVEPNELIKFIKDGLKISEFKVKEFRNKKTSLFMSSIDDYVRAKAYLEKSKTKFFTYTPKITKTKTYLLKGLSAEMDMNDILGELCKFRSEYLKFEKVSAFTTKKATKEGYKLPIYLVQISNDSKVDELKKIKSLLYRCVHWEPLRKPEITQCRNCQSFLHSASNCFLPHRCVKCNETHDIGKCPLQNVPENEKEKLFCVLCKKYGHPASYKGCEKYKELQRKIRFKRQNLSQIRTNNKSIHVNDNMTFADTVKMNNIQNVNNNPIQVALEQLNQSMQNLSNQIINLNKQLQLQVSRIDTIFTILES